MANYYIYPPVDPQFHNYNLLSSIYQGILNTFDQYQPVYKLRVKSSINQDIINKLNNIKTLENDITNALVNAELKNKLQVASRGQIDPDRIPDEVLPELLKKHSNLLGLTSTYNNNVKELADMLTKINNVLIDRSGPISMSVSVPLAAVQPPSVPWGATGENGYPVILPNIIY